MRDEDDSDSDNGHTRLINVDTKQIEAGGHDTIIYYTFLFNFIYIEKRVWHHCDARERERDSKSAAISRSLRAYKWYASR